MGSRMILVFIFAGILSCGSRVNRVSYEVEADAAALDSVKAELVALGGIMMVNLSADSSVFVVDYDRMKCSQKLIEEGLDRYGLHYELQKKEKINGGDDDLL